MTVVEEFERLGELVHRVPFPPTPDARETRAEALMLVAATAFANVSGMKPDWHRDTRLADYLSTKAQKWLERHQ